MIATAPQKRLAIKTFVSRIDDGIARSGCGTEARRTGVLSLQRGGNHRQYPRAAGKLLPEARIAVAHGQMPERELEAVMRDFHQQRFNLLLHHDCRTGIDVPTANTIIIHRADRFGLAQLHQLRGRVGRSHHQAYAYLLTPEEVAMTPAAKKAAGSDPDDGRTRQRLHLAMHDLEIPRRRRGAGRIAIRRNVEIGFSLTAKCSNNAVKALKRGEEPDLTQPLG